ncbi:hypothetical protein C2S51_020652 [Perilla frutescens var. frutescens]|nr:hypothetical protein C2S51_020652 [Perilla frutescens var. frutescens]
MGSGRCRKSNRGALVSGRGYLSWLDTIQTHLSKENQLLLSESCFGHFLAIPDIQLQGQLYAVLIQKLERSSLARMRLAFRINERVIEFGPREFSLMTELRMDGWEEPPRESVFHKTFFHGKTDLVFCDIQKSFVQECVATRGESRNTFVLALLYILYGILLIRARKGKKIDLKYLHLVDDLSRFNYYGWGQVAYEFLVRTTHHAREIMDNLIAEDKNLAFDANGFAIALQMWVYEVDIVLSEKEHERLVSLGANDINHGPLSPTAVGAEQPKPRKLPTKESTTNLHTKGEQPSPNTTMRHSLRLNAARAASCIDRVHSLY